MQEESGSVENTPAQEEKTVVQEINTTVEEQNNENVNESVTSKVKKTVKQNSKKKKPRIPTVNEIVEKETDLQNSETIQTDKSDTLKQDSNKSENNDQSIQDNSRQNNVIEHNKSEQNQQIKIISESETKTDENIDSKKEEITEKPDIDLEVQDNASEYPDEDVEDKEEILRARANLNLDSETALIETILFLESEPQNTESLSKISQLSVDVVNEAITRLREKYSCADSGIEIGEIIGGWMLIPKKESFDLVKEKYGKKNEGRLSKAAIETLSIIAYSQPITRAEIESIRHVNADNMMRVLLDRHFIKEVDKKDIPGKPSLYGTTKEFLEFFHLQSIADLPQLDEKESERFELAR